MGRGGGQEQGGHERSGRGWAGGGGGGGKKKKEEVSEQEAQLLIYVEQWMKAGRRPGARTALKLKSISSLDCKSLVSAPRPSTSPADTTSQGMKKTRGKTRLDLCPPAQLSIYSALICRPDVSRQLHTDSAPG